MSDLQLIVVTLIFSGFFSGMEIAFVSSNRLRIELDLKKHKFAARLLNPFYKNPSRFIGALLLGNNIALVIYGIVMAGILEPFIISVLPAALLSDFMVLLIQTLLSTLLILIVAEFLPKILFRINPNGILNFLALPVWIFYYLLYPFIILYIGLAELILKYGFRMNLSQDDYRFSTVDLNEYVREYISPQQDETQTNHDIQLFQNALEFKHVKLRECMVPRTEIEAVKSDESMDVVVKKFEETKHSKLLVYENSIDNIIGYVHSYDVYKRPKNLQEVLRTIEVFPETYPANLLLRYFIQARQGIAVVVDEFGGTAGIVSMEDVIEEIFGEIEDEYDEVEDVEVQLAENEFHFSTRLEIDYLNEIYKLNLPESDEYETLAGFILYHHESIPNLGEEITIEDYRIKVLKASDNKIEEVKLKVLH
ncbi:MAG: HlyC/CorC family transporter [Bacteroidales bacterium]|nr:HlyC/CorC family transporter [Bacteroidales bacterium]MDN5350427.1 magnesium and cobalt exporter, family [Bacteroidales bacterium]